MAWAPALGSHSSCVVAFVIAKLHRDAMHEVEGFELELEARTPVCLRPPHIC